MKQQSEQFSLPVSSVFMQSGREEEKQKKKKKNRALVAKYLAFLKKKKLE